VRYRRVYLAPDAASPMYAQSPASTSRQNIPQTAAPSNRRPAVNEPMGPPGVNPSISAPAPAAAPRSDPAPPAQGGWRKIKPGEQP
jgi:hypothetical protein